MTDDSDDDVSFHLLLRPLPEPLPNDVPPNRKDSSSSSRSPSSSRSTSSSSSEQVQATASQEPPSKRQRKGKGKGKGRANRSEKTKQTNAKENDEDKTQRDIDSTQLCSTAALGWAKRVCSFAYQNDGECAYDHVDVFTEFSGSTCAESAVESVINHMNPKPTLNFCYSADIKSGCRKVAMSTRYDLGCLKHTNKNIVITMPTTWFLFFLEL
jgi:hypothetical protein